MTLPDLAAPFPADDIEWRVSRAGNKSGGGIFCRVVAYITARAIQRRLDDVCGPENWRNEKPEFIEIRPGIIAVTVGLSIRIGDEWITKYNVAEPTNFEAVKGGFSQATKRAGAEWGIGRYLYRLDETFAEVSESKIPGYHFERLPEKQGGGTYYWKPPKLPDWALPPELEDELAISKQELNELKSQWCNHFAPDVKSRSEKRDGFERFVSRIVGEFPCHDHSCWTPATYDKVDTAIQAAAIDGTDSTSVPFGGDK